MTTERRFRELFGCPPTATASAPGRVNLMGEHTDYNAGYVLPMPIPQETEVALALREDRTVRLFSENLERKIVSYQLGEEQAGAGWIDYVQGVTRELAARGQALTGFDVYVRSAVPVGAGLSSSAALEVALLRALRTALDLPLSNQEIARIGQGAEVNFVGAPVGIMDQMAASLGHRQTALFIDTQSLATRDVAIPDELELAVIASGITHDHATGDYRQRRAECTRAVLALGVHSLRELDRRDLPRIDKLDTPLDRRARHVVTENERVLATVEALGTSDLPALRSLFAASHASMRDDFQVSVPAIDHLVALATAEPGVVGARLTGGGFGGSVVLLMHREGALRAARAIAARYAQDCKQEPRVLLPLESADG